jgi:FlaA1/EpsC-like NDP-sugar epimerase
LGLKELLSLTKVYQKKRLLIVDQCLEFNYKVYRTSNHRLKIKRNFSESKEISNRGFTRAKPIVLDSKSISKQLKDKTILVTGAAGSIGSEIVRQVLRFNPKE